jgi:hypothetical protein
LPDEVLINAKRVSEEFEEEINGGTGADQIQRLTEERSIECLEEILNMVENAEDDKLLALWNQLRTSN